jgi:uncharacterized protein YfbU (UPF0304 family)
MDLLKPKKNQQYRRLTIERVRREKGLEHLTDEEALDVIDTLEQYAIIMYNLFKRQNDEQQITSSKICKGKAA